MDTAKEGEGVGGSRPEERGKARSIKDDPVAGLKVRQ